MSVADVNYLAVFAAAVAAWIFGAAWYMGLAKPWMRASGWASQAEMLGPGGKASPLPFVIAFVAELVMAYFLAGLIAHLGDVERLAEPRHRLLRLARLRRDDARRSTTASGGIRGC